MREIKQWRGRLDCSVISPLFIGDGNVYKGVDIHVDERQHRIRVLDVLGWIQESRLLYERTNQIILEGETWKISKAHYELPLKSWPRHSVRELKAFIKTPDILPYIPGSSMKGALRTLIMRFLQGEPAKDLRLGKKNKNHQKQYQKNIVGRDFYRDIFRAFHISDSQPIPTENLNAVPFTIASLQGNALMLDSKRHSHPFFVEALKPGTTWSHTISVEAFGDFYKKNKMLLNDPHNLMRLLKEEAERIIHEEISFYTQHKAMLERREIPSLINFYKKMANRDTVSIPLGFGTGWHMKTLKMSKQLKDELRKNAKQLGRRGVPEFPKSRKVCRLSSTEFYPMGWIEVRLSEIQ